MHAIRLEQGKGNKIKEWCQKDAAILAFVVFAGLAVHGAVLIEGFGEQDAARLVNDAIIWRDNPEYLSTPDVEYRPRVLPLSLILTRSALQAGIAASSMPVVMNVVNLVFGALLPAVLYLAWSRIVGRRCAYLAIAFVATMPAVWFSSIYGYPHLVSFTLFAFSLYLFLVGLDRKGHAFFWWSALSALVLGIGLGIKADIILAFGAFFGVIWLNRRVDFVTLATVAGIGAFGAFVPWILHEVIAHPVADAATYAGEWSERFPISPSAMFSQGSLLIKARVGGYVYSLLILVAIYLLLRHRDDRRIVIFVCLWALPIVLFWDLRQSNSARHLFAAIVPAGLLIACLIRRMFAAATFHWPAAVLAIALNYAVGVPGFSTVSPSPRLVESSLLLQAWVTRMHREASSLAHHEDAKIFLLGNWANPYVTFSMLEKAISVEYLGKSALELSLPGGIKQRFERAYVTKRAKARKLAVVKSIQGFRIVSLNYNELALLSAEH